MVYGFLPPSTVPKQDERLVLLTANRWQRSSAAMQTWAEKAKECVDFVEGRQWTEGERLKMQNEGRPALTFNKLAPLVRLIQGYHRNNRTDLRAMPGHDGTGNDEVAEAITRILKQVSITNELDYIDAEVFYDGLITGRGFYDTRLDFDNNDFGEIKTVCSDPFSIYIDPDATSYNLDDHNFLIETRMASIDEIEETMGRKAADMVRPFTKGSTPLGPVTTMWIDNEITPVRSFGHKDETDASQWWDTVLTMMGDYVDPLRKSLRIIDMQHKVTQLRKVFVDLETGDRKVVPDHWDDQRIAKCLWHAQRLSNPLTVEWRRVKRIRWTTMIADYIAYDNWSPYEGFTKTGFFPYFRRGQSRGMVDDLIDPQREINKRRSATIEIVMRTPHSGWKYHESSMTPAQKQKLLKFGSSPGFNLEYSGKDPSMAPTRIEPAVPPTAMEKLELHAAEDLRQISGINESALGELDRVQSGRAIEARQRQAVIAVQVYMDNASRTKRLLGLKFINLIQNHYTEERKFRTMGEDSKAVMTTINKARLDPVSGNLIDRLNDVTIGKYSIVLDESPMSATFLNAQFEEAIMLLEKLQGSVPPTLMADILVDLSTLPRKDEIKQRLNQILAAQGIDTGAGGMMPGMVPGVPPGALPGGGGPAMLPGSVDPNAPALDQSTQPGGRVIQLQPQGVVMK